MMSRQAVENEDVQEICPSQSVDLEATGGTAGSLEFRNLKEEAEYLYEDNCVINQKLEAQIQQNEALNRQLNHLHCELEKNKEDLVFRLTEENVALKKKLAELDGAERRYNEAICELSKCKTEIDFLKNLYQKNEAEAREFKTQAETLTLEKENIKDRCQEAEKLTVKTNQKCQELMTKLETLSAIYDMQERTLRQEKQRSQKLEKNLQILMNPNLQEEEGAGEIRDGRFQLIQNNSTTECGRCHQRCDLINKLECDYHTSQPFPPQTWKILLPEQLECHSPDQFYWPCCDKFGRVKPEGCHMEPHHDFPS